MAKDTKKPTSDAVTQDTENVQQFQPGVKGIVKPLSIAMAGSEGAKAAREYHTFGAGQIASEDLACDYPSPEAWSGKTSSGPDY
jgi:hypothetical protein